MGEPPDRAEDWLNHVVPALMFFRSFAVKKGIALTALTIDAQSVAMIDARDPSSVFGTPPGSGQDLDLALPSNVQSSEQALRDFVDACTAGAP